MEESNFSTGVTELKERVLQAFDSFDREVKKEKKRVAFITGITGQDGSYLAEFLLGKGYEVHGLVRRVALEDPFNRLKRIYHIKDKLILHPGNIESYSRLIDIVDKIKPDECYHLASQSFVYESFEDSFSTFMTNIEGTLNVINALHKKAPKCKFYFAGSSEMFGKVQEVPQTENTPFHPRSPYGITKVAGFDLTRNFRESYNLFACNGILFNHESPRRGFEFVTRKITSGIKKIKEGTENTLVLGNLDAKRDWGFAGDYVEAMWMMLQQEKPKDYVISTGETYSIRDFLSHAFEYVGINYEIIDLHELSKEEANEKVEELKKEKGKVFVVQHPIFYRPAEVNELLGNPKKAKEELGWVPRTKFNELVRMMVEADLRGNIN
ncbi:GDP-mannose 4,6-dehydratase [Candidatus Pacearchaeota archaeon CG10_big_fil_rev_8_21_14_0_10_34_12]|nr:MAG: GDP-mannose 4,6-dehydratase [Candidatus Pacearchaeota archaeon CG10_big_fil_rev_8_21_14_0_10_34_12]